MPGDAQATRQRLLAAAAAEFAERGIAGARVDRIAAAAHANKAQIYHYFGSKDDLFDAVFDELVTATVSDSPLDPDDLPGYAAALFDRYEAHPEIARLATWYRLERSSTRPPHALRASAGKDKIARIRAAQKAGRLPTTFTPDDLLALVTSLAAMWTGAEPEDHGSAARRSRAHRRGVVVDAVRALLAA
ncbi:MAG TPA: TetR family transcriptional regulator [Baekduia sp.]